MKTVKIVPDRSGRVWPLVLGAVRESRREGRRLVLCVPEQYTLQAERDLIAGLELPGLLDIQVISPRKLRHSSRIVSRGGGLSNDTNTAAVCPSLTGTRMHWVVMSGASADAMMPPRTSPQILSGSFSLFSSSPAM